MSTGTDIPKIVADELSFDPLVDAANILATAANNALHWDATVPAGLEGTVRDDSMVAAASNTVASAT